MNALRASSARSGRSTTRCGAARSREWATTQTVKRVSGAKAKSPHAEAKRELAEARAEKEALLDEVRALGRKQKVSPADLKAVAEKHGKSKAKPGKKEK